MMPARVPGGKGKVGGNTRQAGGADDPHDGAGEGEGSGLRPAGGGVSVCVRGVRRGSRNVRKVKKRNMLGSFFIVSTEKQMRHDSAIKIRNLGRTHTVSGPCKLRWYVPYLNLAQSTYIRRKKLLYVHTYVHPRSFCPPSHQF